MRVVAEELGVVCILCILTTIDFVAVQQQKMGSTGIYGIYYMRGTNG